MIGSAKSWRPVTAALVVALGLMVGWALLLSWGSTIADTALQTQGRVRERLRLAADGTPVITSSTYRSNIELNRRTLDGQAWPLEYEKWLQAAKLPKPDASPGPIPWPLSWQRRFVGGSDGKHPPTAWYLLRNAEPVGRVWFAGFDAMSKRPIGFLGQRGFRPTPPPQDEQWLLPETRRSGLRDIQAGSQNLGGWNLVSSWNHNLNEEQRPAPWLIYLTAADRLVEIDLRKRSARTVLELDGLQSISKLSWWEPKDKPSPPDPTAHQSPHSTSARFASLAGPDFDSLASASADTGDQKKVSRFALRTTDRIVLYEPISSEKREWALPESLRNKVLTLYTNGQDDLFLLDEQSHWKGGIVAALVWISPAGKIVREEKVLLAGWHRPSKRKLAWMAAAGAPVPLGWLTGMTLVKPLAQIQSGDSLNYRAALGQTLGAYWPQAVVVLVLALFSAGVALRLHRRYHRPQSGLWWLFVFLLGPAGLLAYWLEHRLPPLEPCPACGRTVPRNRDGCPDCGEAFAPPKLIGTEVFA